MEYTSYVGIVNKQCCIILARHDNLQDWSYKLCNCTADGYVPEQDICNGVLAVLYDWLREENDCTGLTVYVSGKYAVNIDILLDTVTDAELDFTVEFKNIDMYSENTGVSMAESLAADNPWLYCGQCSTNCA